MQQQYFENLGFNKVRLEVVVNYFQKKNLIQILNW